jgi:AraC-like DNA-binding protein
MILLDQAGAGATAARSFPPPRAQELLVEHFWAQQIRRSPTGRTWWIIPDPNPHMIFVVSREGSRVQARCTLVGPRSRFTDVAMANRILTCGARLRPGALPLLTGFPASDFTDRSVPVETAFGARGRLLMERLGELRSPFRALGMISDFLSHEWTGQNRALRVSFGQCTRVEEMATQAGLPIRTLHGRLMQHVGLSPKRLLRIERLHRALAASQSRSVAWAQVAAISGFADQAHMIREFVDLLGESPSIWRGRSPLPICPIQPSIPPITVRCCQTERPDERSGSRSEPHVITRGALGSQLRRDSCSSGNGCCGRLCRCWFA